MKEIDWSELLTENRIERFREVACKITISSHKWLDIFFFKSVEECVFKLKDLGFKIFSSCRREDSVPHYELVKFNGKLALVFGNEKNGVSEGMLKYSDGFFWIPMFGFSESLNISVAAAITISRIREDFEKSRENFLVDESRVHELVQKWILKDTEKYRV